MEPMTSKPTTSTASRVRRPRFAVPAVLGAIALIAAACSSSASPSQQAATLITQGLAAQTGGNYAGAATDYAAAVKLDPSNSNALYDLGDVEQIEGNDVAAAANYRATLALSPDYVAALYNLAIIEVKTAPAEGISLYQQVIKLSPSDAPAHFNLGYEEYQIGEKAAGIAQLKEAIALDPSLAAQVPSSIKL